MPICNPLQECHQLGKICSYSESLDASYLFWQNIFWWNIFFLHISVSTQKELKQKYAEKIILTASLYIKLPENFDLLLAKFSGFPAQNVLFKKMCTKSR